VDSLDPTQVNWFKYYMDKYLKLVDEDGNQSALNSPDAYVNLLNMIISRKSDEEIQNEMLDLVGFHNFELLEKLISKRQYIKERCKIIDEQLQQERNQAGHKPKFYEGPSKISVTVEKAGGKKGKKNRGGTGAEAEMKLSNYDILQRLGFDRMLIEQNKRLGLKEKAAHDSYQFKDFVASHMEQKAQVYEQKQLFKDYKIDEKDGEDWKEVSISPPPPAKKTTKDLIPIADLPKWAQGAFKGTSYLNLVQSKVFECAFKSNNNMLIAAPTGAGKTNIALLSILREVSGHDPDECKWDMSIKQFKIIYIAPLKALASEIVGKFQKALAYLKIKVAELTGDMNMSKAEIHETHIIVTTPEKWDVVTRKTDGMMDLVNMIIIDEIHLLNDERGLVLECLVARALMTGMKNQKPIRLVGLSATLPNYLDVARFMQASEKSTFSFDSSYRPTPLKCSFYGIKDMGNS